QIYQRGVLTASKKFQRNGRNYIFTLLTNNVARQLNTADVFSYDEALAYADKQIASLEEISNKAWLAALAQDHVKQNYIYDERLTDKLEKDALDNLSTTRGMVQKGELIVAEGAVVTPEIYQKLESLRTAYEKDASIIGDRKQIFLGQVMLAGLVLVLL